MPIQIITKPHELSDLCRRLAQADVIAFDTEFVSEYTYRPQLCLLQVATRDQRVLVDPLAVEDLTPFWRVLVEGAHETVVHAGREEMIFCLEAVGQTPQQWFDVQLAAGFVGLEYPASYGTLIGQLLGKRLSKMETRTDWRRRPLSSRQLQYAADDVAYLLPLRDTLWQQLEQLQRMPWLRDETLAWREELLEARAQERWRRVSGTAGLSRRSMAVVRELWRWREQRARDTNLPPRQILRDDLIVELARRQTADPEQIRLVRGVQQRRLKSALGEIAGTIRRALDSAEPEPAAAGRRDVSSKFSLVSQLLQAALSSLCRSSRLAPNLVGTAADLRELVSWRLESGEHDETPPRLARGWRAEVVGRLLDDVLAGQVCIRVRDPRSNQPLSFERLASPGTAPAVEPAPAPRHDGQERYG